MTWCNDGSDVVVIDRGANDHQRTSSLLSPPASNNKPEASRKPEETTDRNTRTCPSCGYQIPTTQEQGGGNGSGGIHDLPGLPAGVKFDPTDSELLEHLEGKVRSDIQKLHPLIDEFIPTLEGENGICYTHPEKLPGVGKDGLIRHFFHRPSKAYTTGTRKRRKVHTDEDGGETRWHKTGKTRPVFVGGKLKGYKKILVLYTNYGKKRKPEKTNWVMHQYHLGNNEEEKDGELVVSKVFFQTQPRQCNSGINNKDSVAVLPSKSKARNAYDGSSLKETNNLVEYYNPSLISYDQSGHNRASPPHLLPNFVLQAGGSSFLP